MGLQPLYGNWPRPLLWAGSRVARGKITVRGMSRPNYCEIFMVYTLFMNMVAERGLETQSVRRYAVLWIKPIAIFHYSVAAKSLAWYRTACHTINSLHYVHYECGHSSVGIVTTCKMNIRQIAVRFLAEAAGIFLPMVPKSSGAHPASHSVGSFSRGYNGT
jgi:hypothetical protein